MAERWERGNYVAVFGRRALQRGTLSMAHKYQQPQATLRLMEIYNSEFGFQWSGGDPAGLIETSGLDLNFIRAMIYRDAET